MSRIADANIAAQQAAAEADLAKTEAYRKLARLIVETRLQPACNLEETIYGDVPADFGWQDTIEELTKAIAECFANHPT